MANIKGKIKRNIKNNLQNKENRKSRSKLKTLIKKSLESSKAPEISIKDKQTNLDNAISYTDSCLSKGLIKQNKANRIKSKLMTIYHLNKNKEIKNPIEDTKTNTSN